MNPSNDKRNHLDIDLESVKLVKPINWNRVQDPIDNQVWDRLCGNFWLPEKIALSGDLKSWDTMSDEEKDTTAKIFAGLTLLDTIQGEVGAKALMDDAKTAHEKAVFANIIFMEEVHAKSYSSIFATLLSSRENDEAFRWSETNEFLKKKAAIILHYYRGNDPEKKKIASTLLESFLFYSGFFMPLWWSSKGKLTNTADIISLIIRDESIHGYYIGAKFQQDFKKASPERQEELETFANDLLFDLYDNELKYAESLYDPIGLTEYVKPFLRYNAIKAFQNLGFQEPFDPENAEVAPQILAQLNPGGDENHDFFSSSGSSYFMGAAKVKEINEDDWESMFE